MKLSDELFVVEMKILWQTSDILVRNSLANIIRGYFKGIRAEMIINKLQETIE
jgi:hypothetical protein